MGLTDLFADFYASLAFTNVHAEVPEADQGEVVGGDGAEPEEGNVGAKDDDEDGGEEEEGGKDEGGEDAEEEEEEEEEEEDEPVDPKPRLEEGLFCFFSDQLARPWGRNH